MYETLQDAEKARLELINRIQAIDVQLTQRAAKVSVGKVPDQVYRDYLAWKGKACGAKQILLTELRQTKEWIKAHKNANK